MLVASQYINTKGTSLLTLGRYSDRVADRRGYVCGPLRLAHAQPSHAQPQRVAFTRFARLKTTYPLSSSGVWKYPNLWSVIKAPAHPPSFFFPFPMHHNLPSTVARASSSVRRSRFVTPGGEISGRLGGDEELGWLLLLLLAEAANLASRQCAPSRVSGRSALPHPPPRMRPLVVRVNRLTSATTRTRACENVTNFLELPSQKRALQKTAIAKKLDSFCSDKSAFLEPQEHVLQLDVQDGSWSLPRSAGHNASFCKR